MGYFSRARNDRFSHAILCSYAFKAEMCVVRAMLSSLRVTAEMDVQQCARVAGQKASGDKSIANSSQGVARALDKQALAAGKSSTATTQLRGCPKKS